jgi:hypothetical protein
MHRGTGKEYSDRATEGWFKSLITKPYFQELIKESRKELKRASGDLDRKKILKKRVDSIASNFNLRKRNFTPLIEQYIETGEIMLNPFELYGVTFVDSKNGISLVIHPGIRKDALKKAIDQWWPMIDASMMAINEKEHKKQYKERMKADRDAIIYDLYLKGIIQYNGSLKIPYTVSALKKYGIEDLPGIDMRKKIIIRFKNKKKI